MLTYRTFRNTDPPVLVALWRSRAGQPGLVQPVSTDLLEQLVFSRLYFDYSGLVLAYDDGQPMGFAHAGFGPNSAGSWISTEAGVTCVIVTRPDCPAEEVTAGLLDRCEAHLRGRGATVFYGGGSATMDPFYRGLYGGSDLPGVLDSDAVARRALAAHGYREVECTVLVRRDLGGFQLAVDRQQQLLRRQMVVEAANDAPTGTFWEAATLGEFDLTRFDLNPRDGGPTIATALFRSMKPAGAEAAARAVGLVSVSVAPGQRHRGLSIFLLGEAFRQLSGQGVREVEAQSREADAAALAMFKRLGFQPYCRGGIWKKG
jgi:ribosomal protein S18 acetylase RimI-like enzyme